MTIRSGTGWLSAFLRGYRVSDTQQASHGGSQPDQAQGAQPLPPLTLECQVKRIADRTQKYQQPANRYF